MSEEKIMKQDEKDTKEMERNSRYAVEQAKESLEKVEKDISVKLSDSLGNKCSGDDWDKYGVPLIRLFPALQATYTDAEIVSKARRYVEPLEKMILAERMIKGWLETQARFKKAEYFEFHNEIYHEAVKEQNGRWF